MMSSKKNKFDIDFEIAFIEGVVRNCPDFIEALSALGDLYTKKGLFEDGLKVDERLALLRPEDPIIHYNLACSYSLLNKIDQSYRAIKRAVSLGYEDIDHLEDDDDLTNLRKDRRFKSYLSRLRKKKEKIC